MDAESRQLLYEDDNGNEIGLDEMLYLDPPLMDRVDALYELLASDDCLVAYQATLLLSAWGVDAGLSQIRQFIAERVDTKCELSPHRLDGFDNGYDEMARSVHFYSAFGQNRELQTLTYKELLALYGECQFKSCLKFALLEDNHTELTLDIDAAIARAFNGGYVYMASQLLPCLARLSATLALPWIEVFDRDTDSSPDPRANVAQGLGFIPTIASTTRLDGLAQSGVSYVAEEAKKSLDRLSKILHSTTS